MRRIIRCNRLILNSTATSLIIHPTITLALQILRIGSSDPEGIFHLEKTGSLQNHPNLCPTFSFPSVGSSGCFGRIVRPWGVGLSEPTVFFPVFFLYLSNSSQRSFRHSKYILYGGLDTSSGTLDITFRRCIGRLDGALGSIQVT